MLLTFYDILINGSPKVVGFHCI